jgi:hypothetical protein
MWPIAPFMMDIEKEMFKGQKKSKQGEHDRRDESRVYRGALDSGPLVAAAAICCITLFVRGRPQRCGALDTRSSNSLRPKSGVHAISFTESNYSNTAAGNISFLHRPILHPEETKG